MLKFWVIGLQEVEKNCEAAKKIRQFASNFSNKICKGYKGLLLPLPQFLCGSVICNSYFCFQ